MKEAIAFYSTVHRQFIWLHRIFIVVLVITSLYWFIVPYFIVQYGNFQTTLLGQLVLAIVICITPSIVTTLHCWIISYYAAKKWSKNGSFMKWLFVFQSVAVSVALLFTIFILTSFVVIDYLRVYF